VVYLPSSNRRLNAGVAATKLQNWVGKSLGPAPGWATQTVENQAFAQSIQDAIQNGYAIKPIQIQVGVPAPGNLGKTQLVLNPW
jgi:filamentous hemagglutinin